MKTTKCIVKTVNSTDIIAVPYTGPDLGANAAGNWDNTAATTGISIIVYGSEYGKGSKDVGNTKDAKFTSYSNKPIILRDKYAVNGSDTAQIGWVEVTSENGANGYLWYLKYEHEAILRFEDQLEMAMIEGEKAAHSFTVNPGTGSNSFTVKGTEGLFAAINSRGLVYNDADFGSTDPDDGVAEFDAILKELDKQGAIEENMIFSSRNLSLAIDNKLANQNSYGSGAIGDVDGVIVPAGTSTVYDQNMGKNVKRPFLHVRYRASEADDRRMKSWITGSVGGNYTSDEDAMNVHFLSERCLCVQAANNFVLLKQTDSTYGD